MEEEKIKFKIVKQDVTNLMKVIGFYRFKDEEFGDKKLNQYWTYIYYNDGTKNEDFLLEVKKGFSWDNEKSFDVPRGTVNISDNVCSLSLDSFTLKELNKVKKILLDFSKSNKTDKRVTVFLVDKLPCNEETNNSFETKEYKKSFMEKVLDFIFKMFKN
jgi:hypothetical protein